MTLAKNILHGIGRFSEEEIALFEGRISLHHFRKDDILLDHGQVCTDIFYIIKGAAYQFAYDDSDEKIIGLHIDKDWCLNYSSFIKQKPSHAIIKAYTDLDVVVLTTKFIHELISISPSFFQLGKVLEDTRLQYFDNGITALKKYNHLFLTRSEVFQKFPLKMIASYLKIAPETLSRIRSKR